MLLINRIIRAARLDGTFFKEAKADATLTNEALLVALAAAVAMAGGNFLYWLIPWPGHPIFSFGAAIAALFIYAIFYAIGFGIFVFLVPLIGEKLFAGKPMTWQEALRPLGYAQAPVIVSILSLVVVLGGILSWAGLVYALVISTFAVKETMELDWLKAGATCIIAWIPLSVLYGVAGSIIWNIWWRSVIFF